MKNILGDFCADSVGELSILFPNSDKNRLVSNNGDGDC